MHDFSVCLFNPAFQGCQNPINGLSLSWTDSAQTVASNSDQPADRKYWTYWPMATWLKLGQTKNNLLFKWLTAIESFNSYTALISRHVSFMRICSCRIFCLLPYFFAYFSKVCRSHILPHKLAFSTAILILFVFLFPISIKFRHLDHLVANRMASSVCPDPSGMRWGSWLQAILYHNSAANFVFMRSAYFLNAAKNWHAYNSN